MVGIERVINAGYDPNEASKLFQHLQQAVQEEDKKDKTPFFFASHPKLQERIENYEEYLNKHPVPPGKSAGIKNEEIFLDRTKKVVLENAILDLKAGRYKSAERGAKKYLVSSPNDAQAYNLLGEICRQQSEQQLAEKAKEHYQKAIVLDASYAEPYKGIGLVYFKEREWMRAKQSLETYLALEPQARDRSYIEQYLKQCTQGSK